MRVYVVISDDFPDSVFATERAAKKYCEQQRAKDKDVDGNRRIMGPRIYWNYHTFDVEEAA